MALDIVNHFSDNLRMDWKKIIQDLTDSGLTQVQIAESCNTGQSHISALSNGVRRSPNWQLGEALIKLHRSIPPKNNSEEAA